LSVISCVRISKSIGSWTKPFTDVKIIQVDGPWFGCLVERDLMRAD